MVAQLNTQEAAVERLRARQQLDQTLQQSSAAGSGYWTKQKEKLARAEYNLQQLQITAAVEQERLRKEAQELNEQHTRLQRDLQSLLDEQKRLQAQAQAEEDRRQATEAALPEARDEAQRSPPVQGEDDQGRQGEAERHFQEEGAAEQQAQAGGKGLGGADEDGQRPAQDERQQWAATASQQQEQERLAREEPAPAGDQPADAQQALGLPAAMDKDQPAAQQSQQEQQGPVQHSVKREREESSGGLPAAKRPALGGTPSRAAEQADESGGKNKLAVFQALAPMLRQAGVPGQDVNVRAPIPIHTHSSLLRPTQLLPTVLAARRASQVTFVLPACSVFSSAASGATRTWTTWPCTGRHFPPPPAMATSGTG
jgi:hypothetical protein